MTPPSYDYRDYTDSPTSAGLGRGPLIALLVAVGVVLIAAFVFGALWVFNRLRGPDVALIRTSTPPAITMPDTATPTPFGAPTATPQATATLRPRPAAGAGTPGVVLPSTPILPIGTPIGEMPPVFPIPTIALKTYPAPQLLAPPDGSRFVGPDAVIVLRWASVGTLAANDYYIVTLNCPVKIVRSEDTGQLLAARALEQNAGSLQDVSQLPTIAPLPTIKPLPWPIPTLGPLPTMIPIPEGLPTITLPITLPLLPGAPIQTWAKDTQWRVPPELYGRLLTGLRQCAWWVMVGGFGQKMPDGTLVGIGISPPSEVWRFTWE